MLGEKNAFKCICKYQYCNSGIGSGARTTGGIGSSGSSASTRSGGGKDTEYSRVQEVEVVLKEVKQQGPGRKQVHKLQATLVRNYDRPTD